MQYKILFTLFCLGTTCGLLAQKTGQPVMPAPNSGFQPKTTAYIGVVHPIATVADGDWTYNFENFYLAGMTMAVILRKAPKYAFNLELVGFVLTDEGESRTTNLMLHPGVTFFGKHDFSITPRMGFETSGRFGPTLVITKKLFDVGSNPVNVNLVNLVRTGNSQETSYTVAVNLTFGF